MNTHSSGYYSIDKDYNILSYNDTAKQLYPNLLPGGEMLIQTDIWMGRKYRE